MVKKLNEKDRNFKLNTMIFDLKMKIDVLKINQEYHYKREELTFMHQNEIKNVLYKRRKIQAILRKEKELIKYYEEKIKWLNANLKLIEEGYEVW